LNQTYSSLACLNVRKTSTERRKESKFFEIESPGRRIFVELFTLIRFKRWEGTKSEY
jgi:hypothetical protein